MKANIQGIEVTGTPEEIAELIRLSKPAVTINKSTIDDVPNFFRCENGCARCS